MASSLSKELRKKYNRRSFRIRKGDKVKIMRGQFKGKEGKIEEVDLKNYKVYIENIEVVKKDGTKTKYPLHPSNLSIVEFNTDDKMRFKKGSTAKKPKQEKSQTKEGEN